MKNETEAKGKEEKRFLWVNESPEKLKRFLWVKEYKENNGELNGIDSFPGVESKMRKIKSILNMFLSYAFEQMQMSNYAKFPSECISLIELLNENMDSLEMEMDEALLFLKTKKQGERVRRVRHKKALSVQEMETDKAN